MAILKEKFCPICETIKVPEDFYARKGGQYLRSECKDCSADQRAKWERRDGHKAYAREYARRRRLAAIQLLGGVCEHCGFDDYRALQIDHIKGQRGKREAGNTVVAKILRGEIEEYQLLCANCNWIKVWTNDEHRRTLDE